LVQNNLLPSFSVGLGVAMQWVLLVELVGWVFVCGMETPEAASIGAAICFISLLILRG
jgi:hypothetical protein